MKVLVVGGGGREHALVWKIAQSPRVKKIYCAPGNPGIARLAERVDIAPTDIVHMAEWAEGAGIDLTIVGPEAPLVQGIVGEFGRRNLPIFGPSQMASELEGSKVYTKQLLERWGVPTAKAAVFDEEAKAVQYVKTHPAPIVVKADGLAQGKGVVVARTVDEAVSAVHNMMGKAVFGIAGRRIVVEDFLEGEEVTVMAFVDGRTVLPMIPSQDHKRLLNGDQGPNTGGMGAYAPLPHLSGEIIDRVRREILEPTVAGMAALGRPFSGVLYAGLMLTSTGPQVIEFNVRFGDPEAQPVLTRLATDVVDVCEAVIHERLNGMSLSWTPGYSACVVLAAEGYPDHPIKGASITGLEAGGQMSDVTIFHAGTSESGGRTISNGGRVLGIIGQGASLKDATTKAYLGVNAIRFDGMQFRADIGWRALEQIKA